MGTQPNRKLSKRKGSGVRPRKLIKDIENSVAKNDYNSASQNIRKAGIKIGGDSVLSSGLIAAAIAYRGLSSTKKSPKEISGESLAKVPTDIKKGLTTDGKEIIREALQYALSKSRK